MEKLKSWWFSRKPRDRRALVVLGVVVPLILFWYLVTRPLADRLKLAHRVLETSRAQALELQKKLEEFAQLKALSDSRAQASSSEAVTALEKVFHTLPAEVASPTLNRATLTLAGRRQSAAMVTLDQVSPADAWQIFAAIASAGVNIAELEVSSDPAKNRLSASFKAW